MPIDIHNWDDFTNITEAEKQLINNQIDYQAKTAAEGIKNQGTIPGHLRDYLNGLFKQKERIFNWKSYFSRVVGNSIKTYIKSTRYKPSYRFKGEPGNTLKFKPKILVAVDTSGSVSNNELADFFTEINHLYKSGVYVEIVEFDTCIQNKFVYKGNKTEIEIVGRGGTDMSDVYKYYIAHPDFSTLVVFTDGYLNVNYPKKRNMV
jgi:predicted metal-dependent peptidase